jgi:hypothetical protein
MKSATPTATPTQEIAELFSELVQRWRRETVAYSDLQKKVLHPAYQRIIGLGPVAIPLILQELQQRPGHWFWALNALTDEDPVPPEATITEATEAWLNWGREQGYL